MKISTGEEEKSMGVFLSMSCIHIWGKAQVNMGESFYLHGHQRHGSEEHCSQVAYQSSCAVARMGLVPKPWSPVNCYNCCHADNWEQVCLNLGEHSNSQSICSLYKDSKIQRGLPVEKVGTGRRNNHHKHPQPLRSTCDMVGHGGTFTMGTLIAAANQMKWLQS